MTRKAGRGGAVLHVILGLAFLLFAGKNSLLYAWQSGPHPHSSADALARRSPNMSGRAARRATMPLRRGAPAAGTASAAAAERARACGVRVRVLRVGGCGCARPCESWWARGGWAEAGALVLAVAACKAAEVLARYFAGVPMRTRAHRILGGLRARRGAGEGVDAETALVTAAVYLAMVRPVLARACAPHPAAQHALRISAPPPARASCALAHDNSPHRRRPALRCNPFFCPNARLFSSLPHRMARVGVTASPLRLRARHCPARLAALVHNAVVWQIHNLGHVRMRVWASALPAS